ncbi:MAG: AAA family ATPase, partial [Saprospiraceae bacterium]
MLNKIGFKNYKLFKHNNELEIKPITILFGKNSSGKSSITKFLYVFFGYLNSNIKEFEPPIFSLNYNEVEIGAEFRDLLYG